MHDGTMLTRSCMCLSCAQTPVHFPQFSSRSRRQSLVLNDVMTKGSNGHADVHKYLLRSRASKH